jgi:hypothetical protein
VCLVLVVGRGRDLGIGHEGGEATISAGAREDLDVQVGQRYHGAHGELVAQRLQRRNVAGVVDARNGAARVRRVLRRRERVGVGRHHRRVLGERRHDVVALADAGEQDAYFCHPPVSPL